MGFGVENPKEGAGRAKLPLHLVPAAASREMALALKSGADKYGAWNWRSAGIMLSTYIGAMRRHIDAIAEGEDIDPESGVSHIGHVLAGAAIVADAAKHGMLNDDRPCVGDVPPFGDRPGVPNIDRSPCQYWSNDDRPGVPRRSRPRVEPADMQPFDLDDPIPEEILEKVRGVHPATDSGVPNIDRSPCQYWSNDDRMEAGEQPETCRCIRCRRDGLHASDCAVHDGPAYVSRKRCDCGRVAGVDLDRDDLTEIRRQGPGSAAHCAPDPYLQDPLPAFLRRGPHVSLNEFMRGFPRRRGET